MPYRIEPGRDLANEVRAVATGQFEDAIEALEKRPEGLHEAIHEARKKFKRLRNLYRLIGSSAKTFRRSENQRLRDCARTLSRVRDATALIETVAHLSAHAITDDEAQTLATVREVLERRRDEIAATETDLEGKVAAVIAECRKGIDTLGKLKLPSKQGHGGQLLAKGWRQGLERAREALEACKGDGHGEAYHDLRKAAQAYWMNLSLMQPLWPSAFAAKRDAAKRLVDLLGHEHDLTILAGLFDEEAEIFGDGQGQSFLLAIIIRHQQELRRQALTLAGKVFADHPRREAQIIACLWAEAKAAGRDGRN
ncbi:CHAD domain-containing protein [Rhizobium sp. AAP43]|uniref:CHAD domain-containing protein n=1 Tax=Rhizobium sp. AAP43 TaxID=1523420 RepID=UPI0006B95CFA|nr:CHAD domain-containing protein [Rhizobium sp. AAP43]KPF46248.1 metal-binding protein [Rhizobium sp. AAP43]